MPAKLVFGWTCMFILVSVPPARAGEIALVRDGKPQATIVTSEKPGEPVNYAARELQEYIMKASGATLPIVAEPQDASAAGARIYLGATRAAESNGISLKGVKWDGYLIKSAGDNLFILGKDVNNIRIADASVEAVFGTANGVHGFLEKFLGIRWFWPGEMGEYVPKTNNIAIAAPVDIRDEPDVMAHNGKTGEWQCRRRNKGYSGISYLDFGGHSWGWQIPASLFAEHPEYFALVGGKRVLKAYPAGSQDASLCTSNPDVLRISVEKIRQVFDAGADAVQIDQTDTWALNIPICECENCRKIGDACEQAWAFHIAIARELYKSHPGKKVVILLYQATSTPPKNITGRFPPNVELQEAQGHLEAFRDLCKPSWGKFVYCYDFTSYQSMCAGPKSSISLLIGKFDNFKTNNIGGIYWCGGGDNWGSEGLLYYLAMRMEWDMRQDPYRVLDEYYAKFYGPAAGPMKAYFEALDKCLARTGAPRGGYSNTPASTLYMSYFPAEDTARMAEILQQAMNAAKGDPVLEKRIRLSEINLEYTRLTAEAFRANQAYQAGKSPKTLQALAKACWQREAYVEEIWKEKKEGKFKGLVEPFNGMQKGMVLYGEGSMLSSSGSFLKLPFDRMLRQLEKGEAAKSARVKSMPAPPVLDGKPDDACWQAAASLPLADTYGAGQPGAGATARIFRDAKHLYIAFECSEPLIDKVATGWPDEKRFWKQDCVEVFLNPLSDKQHYLHFAVNTSGAMFSGRMGYVEQKDIYDTSQLDEDRSWKPQWKAAIALDKSAGKWTAEIAIPFEQLEAAPPAAGLKWTANFCRTRKPEKELSSWSPTFGNFGQAELFGTLDFE